MKRIKFLTSVTFLFFIFSHSASSQCTLACYSDINVSLDASGMATLTPEMILADIPIGCGSFTVSPNTFTCADVGTTTTVWVTSLDNENSCFSNITIEDKSTPSIACYSNINAVLPLDGTLELTAAMLLASESDNCPLSYTIVPDVLTCTDVGTSTPVTITATDPGGNTVSCFTNVNLQYNPLPLICQSELNVSLSPSGLANITPEMILLEPSPPDCALQVSIPMVSCADIGTPVQILVIDWVNGNSCFTTINVEDKTPPSITCNALTNVQLGAGGILTLDANDFIASSADNCPLSFALSPAQVDCTDKGKTRTINITATDASGNTASCTSDVFVEDPKPSSCNVITPSSVPCGASGIGFNATVSGGYGPFTYEWSIKGKTNGWSITGGQGTANVIMDVGIKKIKLAVKITDVCGKSINCQATVNCGNAAFQQVDVVDQAITTDYLGDLELKVFPNPTQSQLSWTLINESDQQQKEDQYQILDINGKVLMAGKTLNQNLDIGILHSGVYFLKVLSGDRVIARRFVKI